MSKTFLVYLEDKELAEYFMSFGAKVSYTYRSDKWIDERAVMIVREREIFKKPVELIALKYGFPVSLVRSIGKKKRHGMYVGKPYSVAEASRIVSNVYGVSMDAIKEHLADRDYVSVEHIDDMHKRGLLAKASYFEYDIEPLISKISRVSKKEIKRRPKVYSLRRSKKLSLESKSEVEYIDKSLDSSTLLEELDAYKTSNLREKGRLRDYAKAVADDVLKVGEKELYVNLDVEGLNRFAERIKS